MMKLPLRLLVPLSLVVVAACASCAPSNTALKRHSHAAELLDDLATDARELVLEQRQAELDQAAAAARARGLAGDELRAAVERAAADFDDGPAIGAVNTLVAAKDVYVRAVLAAAADDAPSWAELRPILRDVVDAYHALRLALGSPDAMPPVPDVVANLLSRIAPADIRVAA
jgi:hypothetical protein